MKWLPTVVAAAALLMGPLHAETFPPEGAWLQWGGPDRNFIVETTGLADKWPDSGPREIWSRPLGNGHSAILADDGRLYTMYRTGNAQGREGPWLGEETVVALDAATGRTLWEYGYPSVVQDFGRGAGPHSTPLIVGDRLFTIGSNKKFHAFDKKTGELLWSHDVVQELGAPPLSVRPIVKSGYACSPAAYKDLVMCFVGGPGQSVVAFRQHDGSIAWKSGHFLASGASPVLIDVDGQDQMVFFAGSLIAGLDPQNGEVLWAHVHDAGNDFNFSLPIWGDDHILFSSSAYQSGSRAIRLERSDNVTTTEELWFSNRTKFQFLNAVRVGDTVYGTHGERSGAFLTALDIKTGESLWRHRGFAQSTLLYADGKLIIMTENGELALARVRREGVTVLDQTQLFDTRSWTVPTLVSTTLYARDREKIVALDLGVQER